MSKTVQAVIVSPSSTLAGSMLKLIAASLMTAGPGVLLAGLVFPLVAYLGEQARAVRVGQRLAWLIALNGLGGLLGAETAYRWLLPAFGVHQSMGAIASIYALAGLAFAAALARRFSPAAALSSVCLLLVVAVSAARLGTLPQINDKFGLRAISISNGRDGAVAVVEHPGFGRGILLQNQYLLGTTAAAPEQARQALLPMLLHPHPRRVALIGLATGSTAAGALRDPAVGQVTVIEISASVVDAARRYFGDVDAGLFADPRARIVIEDGRTCLAASCEAYDVIVGDLFLPWQPGTGRLYSLEHFAAVRHALAPGGLFCQWLPLHQFTEEQFEVCAATLERVFGKVQLFRGNLDPDHPLLGLVAWKGGELDWGEITNHCAALCQGHGSVHDPLLRHPEGLALLYLGPAPAPGEAQRINTLGNAWLEMDAGRERLTGNPAAKYLTHDRWLSFSQAQVERSTADASRPPGLSTLAALGQLATRAQGFEERGRTIPKDLVRALRAYLPAAVAADPEADWNEWPGLCVVKGKR